MSANLGDLRAAVSDTFTQVQTRLVRVRSGHARVYAQRERVRALGASLCAASS